MPACCFSGTQRRGLPAAAGGEHVLPAGVRSAGAKVLAASATGISWRPRLKGNGRYLLAAWFGPAVFTVLAAVLYFAVFPSRLDTSGSWLATAYGGQWTPEALKTELGVTTTSYLIQNGLAGGHAGTACQYDPRCGQEAVGAAI